MKGIDSPYATNTRLLKRLRTDCDRRIFKGRARYKEMYPYMNDCCLWKEDVFDYYQPFPPGY